MPKVNQDIEDALIKHQVYILRVEGSQARDMIVTIDSTLPELGGVLALWLENARKGQQVTVLQEAQFKTLERQVSKIRGASITEAKDKYIAQSLQLVEHEIEYMEGLFIDKMPVKLKYDVPDSNTVGTRLVSKGSWKGATIEQWFDNIKSNDLARIMSTVRFGVTQGKSNDDIVRDVRGTRALNYTDGVINTTRNDANRMVRTITNGLANDSRSAFAIANADILKGERYTATLDGRTTIICADLDGTVVQPGHGPRPPQHFNCRSTMVPVVDLGGVEDQIGERPFVRDTRTRRFRERDFRKEARLKAGSRWDSMTAAQKRGAVSRVRRKWAQENIGTVAPTTNYEEWLKRQSKDFQEDVLGKTRAKLWRSGKADLGDFVDRSGKVLSVEQLRKLEG